ncbi:MAG: DUF3494 domain-containing protein [Lewinellaceae bacterium]|nr:DUF3494 domain-containing protein [Lewinellaceae bacterium]
MWLLLMVYLDGLTCGQVLATPFGNNQTLTPNIYCISSAAVLNANLTLDAGGNPSAIFISRLMVRCQPTQAPILYLQMAPTYAMSIGKSMVHLITMARFSEVL